MVKQVSVPRERWASFQARTPRTISEPTAETERTSKVCKPESVRDEIPEESPETVGDFMEVWRYLGDVNGVQPVWSNNILTVINIEGFYHYFVNYKKNLFLCGKHSQQFLVLQTIHISHCWDRKCLIHPKKDIRTTYYVSSKLPASEVLVGETAIIHPL